MANYCCTIRTNYFHVNDAVGFEEFMGRIYGQEDCVELWQEKGEDGTTVFGFCCHGGIGGVRNANFDVEYDSDESAYDEFLSGLQKYIEPNDAVIILETGNEKMRYVVGSATIITQKEIKYIDITHIAVDEAAKMLGNPEFQTKCEY